MRGLRMVGERGLAVGGVHVARRPRARALPCACMRASVWFLACHMWPHAGPPAALDVCGLVQQCPGAAGGLVSGVVTELRADVLRLTIKT